MELVAAVARDLDAACVREVNDRAVLLPAASGFEHPDHVVLNPSFYVIPAFDALAQLMPDGRWLAARDDGLALLREARFGNGGACRRTGCGCPGSRRHPWPPRRAGRRASPMMRCGCRST
ncbi:glycosyl hydrolase family 8 [Teichococcus vastitatis]|uniref:glycosyl hydrolase family 8 n=1 Tax=Teichococcus vastitatis TaxID=2307076 RepID=UPI00346293BC